MSQKEEREKQRLVDANNVIIFGRWFYVGAIGITAIISKLMGGPNVNFTPLLMLTMFGASYGLNIIYFLYFRYYSHKTIAGIKTISFMQMVVDAIVVTLAIYFAGGIISISFLYYLYSLIGSAFIYSFWGVTLVATIDSIAYSSLLLLEYYGVIPFMSRYNIGFESQLALNIIPVVTNIFAVVTSFYIIGYFSGLLAISMRKKEKEIEVERDKEKAIISDLSDGLIYINNQNLIDMINVRAEKLLNFKAEDVIGKKIKDLNFKKMPLLKEVLQADNQSRELSFSGAQDNYIRITTVEVNDDNQKLIGVAKIIQDISREKYVDKIKSEFITIAGHQLRTPLSAIKGALALFLSGDYGEINREQQTMIKQSYDYTERLIKIVNDMLNVSSAEDGKFNYEFIKTDIKDFVEKNSQRYIDEADNKKISLSFNFAKELPSVELDQRKFRLVLNALLENSLVYNKEKGKVKLDLSKKDDKLFFVISDTGIGIPEEVQEKVFTKFFRADNALKFFTEGNGLDLFVVKNIIENHQGDIWFESEAGKGTTFFITIPFTQTQKGTIKK